MYKVMELEDMQQEYIMIFNDVREGLQVIL